MEVDARQDLVDRLDRVVRDVREEARGVDVVKTYMAPVIHLLDHLDLILRHGLKERYRLFEASSEPPNYWAFVAKKTFPRNVDYIQSLVGSRAGLDRGRAWLALALSESALQTYFQQFADDHKLASDHYAAHALLMDSGRLQVVETLLGDLNDIAFQLPVEQAGTPLRSAAPSLRLAAAAPAAVAVQTAAAERPVPTGADVANELPPLVPHNDVAVAKKKPKRKVVAIAETGAPTVLPSRPATASVKPTASFVPTSRAVLAAPAPEAAGRRDGGNGLDAVGSDAGAARGAQHEPRSASAPGPADHGRPTSRSSSASSSTAPSESAERAPHSDGVLQMSEDVPSFAHLSIGPPATPPIHVPATSAPAPAPAPAPNTPPPPLAEPAAAPAEGYNSIYRRYILSTAVATSLSPQTAPSAAPAVPTPAVPADAAPPGSSLYAATVPVSLPRVTEDAAANAPAPVPAAVRTAVHEALSAPDGLHEDYFGQHSKRSSRAGSTASHGGASTSSVDAHEHVERPYSHTFLGGKGSILGTVVSAITHMGDQLLGIDAAPTHDHSDHEDEFVVVEDDASTATLTSAASGATSGGSSSVVWTICPEQGLDSQNFKCFDCGALIGLRVFGEARLCGYNGRYYCTECHTNELIEIPGRYTVIHNWDFRRYKVSHRSYVFIKSVWKSPSVDLAAYSALGTHVEEIKDVKLIRRELVLLGGFIQTCKASSRDPLLRLIAPRDHLLKDNEMYSLQDLVDLQGDLLLSLMRRVIVAYREHVGKCELCKAKGYFCEFCRSKEIIYPFDFATTVRCNDCRSLAHKKCYNRAACPKCARIARVAKQASERTPI